MPPRWPPISSEPDLLSGLARRISLTSEESAVFKHSLSLLAALCQSYAESVRIYSSSPSRAVIEWYEGVVSLVGSIQGFDLVGSIVNSVHFEDDLRRAYANRPPEVLEFSRSLPIMQPNYKIQTIDAFQTMLSSDDAMETAHNLQQDDLAALVNYTGEVLDDSSVVDVNNFTSRKAGLVLLRKLYRKSGLYPSLLSIPSEILHTGSALQPVASGGFADVWKGSCRGEQAAIKVYRIVGRDVPSALLKRVLKMALISRFLRHPNIIPFYGVNTELFPLCSAHKWMPNGDINRFLRCNPRAHRVKLVVDIAEGLKFLHDMDYLRAELKGDAVLIDKAQRACISAYEEFDDQSLHISSVYPMTTRWAAPEIIDPERFGLERSMWTRETDIYAFSTVMWEVFTGRIPFYELSREASVMRAIVTDRRPQRPIHATSLGLSNRIWDLMQRCWSSFPSDRPDMTDVLGCLDRVLHELGEDAPEAPEQWPLVMT
ncbi:kinase-like protein [Obba rivulosa]|uniref:Kinase-like protein n=1 Tax=Obba rivulosa TaxID=1052685 RepID=A0A8E2AYJ9_9APHY|nr:kinase-like protein [Obba rivulosa]